MTNQIVIPNQYEDSSSLHFVLVPQMAQGHMIPMLDMAKLIAGRGAVVTFVTTPFNANRVKTIIERAEESELPIRFVVLRFPSKEAGLPDGCENVDILPSRDLMKNFVEACSMLRDPLITRLKLSHPRPSCVISDFTHPWTRSVAEEFGIPRLTFHGFGCFALLCVHNIREHKIHETVLDENEPFVLPGMPQEFKLTRAQAPGGFFNFQGMEKFREEMRAAEAASYGVVVNSFDALEPTYSKLYQQAIGKNAWTIGPLSLCNSNLADTAVRGNKAAIDENQCLQWLDSKEPSSVLYVSFGSLARTTLPQIVEVGLGLEAANRPFIWVIKASDKAAEVEEWLAEGFEQRTRTRGLIIRGWAPQVMILSHPAVGGFMTHCGWNSTLEAVTSGVPMITWPHFAEQFLNEKLVVEVLKIGVPMGVKYSTLWATENGREPVARDAVEKAVARLMDEGEEAEKRRRRAKVLGEQAGMAVEEGGPSYQNLTFLMEDVCSGAKEPRARLQN